MRAGSWLSATAALLGLAAGALAEPAFRADFETACLDPHDWRVSARLDAPVGGQRVRCVDQGGGRAVAITVAPGDAYDPNPGSKPTERVEIQLRREVVRFDRPVWYSFRFQVAAPWLDRPNRTVIHQIKQNIDPRYEKGRGGMEICDAANPLFKIEVDSDGRGTVFRAKVAGSDSCGDSLGQSLICGDWPLEPGRWHRVQAMLLPAQQPGRSHLALALDGRSCPVFTGVLGYPRFGMVRDGRPVIDTQPRFGIYRDALPDRSQTILFDDISFWDQEPRGEAGWAEPVGTGQP